MHAVYRRDCQTRFLRSLVPIRMSAHCFLRAPNAALEIKQGLAISFSMCGLVFLVSLPGSLFAVGSLSDFVSVKIDRILE